MILVDNFYRELYGNNAYLVSKTCVGVAPRVGITKFLKSLATSITFNPQGDLSKYLSCLVVIFLQLSVETKENWKISESLESVSY